MKTNRIVTISTPEGPLQVIRPVAEGLLREGVISGDLDGALRATEAATVKAWMMGRGVCDFCSAPGPTHAIQVPDFEMADVPVGMRSTGGWAACDACAELIVADKREALLKRCLETLSFPKFSRGAIAELHARFWRGVEAQGIAREMAAVVADFVEDRLPDLQVRITGREKRAAAVRRISGLTEEDLAAVLAGGDLTSPVATKLLAWRKQFGKVDPRTLSDLLDPPKKLAAPGGVPHWQAALDAKFRAIKTVGQIVSGRRARATYFPESVDLKDGAAVKRIHDEALRRRTIEDMGLGDDVKLLRAARVYSFSAETSAAIREAASTIPRETPLSSIKTPATGAGWFWFAEPLPVPASPIVSDCVPALLWGWAESEPHVFYRVNFDPSELLEMPVLAVERLSALRLKYGDDKAWAEADMRALAGILKESGVNQAWFDAHARRYEEPGEPALMFSAYVMEGHAETFVTARGDVLPSTRWFWPFSMTFEEMLARSGASWETQYGPGGTFEGAKDVAGKEATLAVITELSLFFLMACVWFEQTVPGKPAKLSSEPGHIERHARKQYQREHALAEPPSVQVVALRKTARADPADAPAERQASARAFHCRFIVHGHPRLQACGPGRKDRKLIWIDSYVKGPEDKPLRTRDRVYAVVR